MGIPRIGNRVRGSSTGRPIMVLLDLLGRRSALRILWELRNGPLTFRGLQEACDTNPALLNTRLKELRVSNIVDLSDAGYLLTRHGSELVRALVPLSAWAEGWARYTPRAKLATPRPTKTTNKTR